MLKIMQIKNKIDVVGYDYDVRLASSEYFNTNSIKSLDDTKFDMISKADFIKAKAEQSGLDESTIENLYHFGSDRVCVTDPHTKVIKVTGTISSNFVSQSDFDMKNKMVATGHDTEDVS